MIYLMEHVVFRPQYPVVRRRLHSLGADGFRACSKAGTVDGGLPISRQDEVAIAL